MARATVTSKGQITIPASIRADLDLKAGDKVEFFPMGNGQVGLIAKNQSVKRLKGMFGKATRTVSIEEMNEAIAERGARLR